MASLATKARALLRVPFVRNVAKFQIGNIVLQVTGLITSIIYVRMLGVEQFGFYAVISAFAGLITVVAAFGQETTLATFLSEAIGGKNPTEIRTVLRYFFQSSAAASFVFLILIIIAPQIAILFKNDPGTGHYARIVLINTALQFPVVLAFLILQLQNRIGLSVTLENTRAILQLICSSILLWFGFGVGGLLAGIALISVLYVPLCLWLYVHFAPALNFPRLSEILRDIHHGGTCKYFIQGFWISFDRNISRNLYPNIFYMILNSFATLEIVGLFRLAFRLAEIPSKLLMPSITRMSTIAIPRVVGGDRKALKSSCIKLVKGTVYLRMLAVIGVAVCIPPFVPLIYGTEFGSAIPIFLALLPYHLFSALNVASIPLARVFKKTWVMTIINTTGMCIAIGLCYLLFPLMAPVFAIIIGILYYHAHSLLLLLYLWWIIRTQKKLSV